MKCPHCTVAINESWTDTAVAKHGRETSWHVELMTCPDCGQDILRLNKTKWTGAQHVFVEQWTQIFPRGSNRGRVPSDVPPEIAGDYNEAAMVLPYSPKASAALSRRCLQAILRKAGYEQHDLAVQIDAALKEDDARKALPTGIHTTLDAIRSFGNFSAHPITDQTTLQIIDVEDHEAEYSLDILDALFDHYYVRPAEAARRRAALDAKLKAAGKLPTKKEAPR
jgi:hypothetical protein